MNHPAELRADALPLHVGTPVSAAEVRELVAAGYRPAYGLGPGKHYQSSRGDGRYHLRVTSSGTGELHRDRWDPERYPLRHFGEVPRLWVPLAIFGGIVWAARRH